MEQMQLQPHEVINGVLAIFGAVTILIKSSRWLLPVLEKWATRRKNNNGASATERSIYMGGVTELLNRYRQDADRKDKMITELQDRIMEVEAHARREREDAEDQIAALEQKVRELEGIS